MNKTVSQFVDFLEISNYKISKQLQETTLRQKIH